MASADVTGMDVAKNQSDSPPGQGLHEPGADHITVDVEGAVEEPGDRDKLSSNQDNQDGPLTETEPGDSTKSDIAGKEKKMETLEIDNGDNEQPNGNETEESFESDAAEMEDLLGGGKCSSDKLPSPQRRLCSSPEKVGNMRIFLPSVFAKTGWGIAGPHWLGPFCVLFLLGLASHYFIGISVRRIGPITAAICILFTAACVYNLANVAFRDPGVVKLQPATSRPQDSDDDQRLQFRWCDRCQVFQPVDGAHCSDCNVCIAGFDHHCVWMGTCIGKKNFKQFVAFNITWLLYLIFAISWVSVLGPLIFGRHPKHD